MYLIKLAKTLKEVDSGDTAVNVSPMIPLSEQHAIRS